MKFIHNFGLKRLFSPIFLLELIDFQKILLWKNVIFWHLKFYLCKILAIPKISLQKLHLKFWLNRFSRFDVYWIYKQINNANTHIQIKWIVNCSRCRHSKKQFLFLIFWTVLRNGTHGFPKITDFLYMLAYFKQNV